MIVHWTKHFSGLNILPKGNKTVRMVSSQLTTVVDDSQTTPVLDISQAGPLMNNGAGQRDRDDNECKVMDEPQESKEVSDESGSINSSASNTRGINSGLSVAKAMQVEARRRASIVVNAYTGALEELREEMQLSPFASWSTEQMQEFLVDNGVEVRESSRLSRAEFEVILEQIFKDCAERPKPPPALTEYSKQRREKAALGKVSQFAQYGVGVTSYFKLLKFCSWSFLVGAASVLPHLVVNTHGNSISPTTTTDKMSWTTVGNLGSSTNVTVVYLPFCDEEEYSTCVIDKETVGLYYGIIDAFLVMVLIAGYFWVNSFILDEFQNIKRNTVTAGDFTVMATNLPPGVTEKELAEHFTRVIGRTVAEVAVARDNRECIKLYAKSGKLYHKRANARDLIRYLKTEAEAREGDPEGGNRVGSGHPATFQEIWTRWSTERKIRRLRTGREKDSRKIIRLTAKAKLAARVASSSVHAAFVTFEQEMGAIEARVKYNHDLLGWLLMGHGMRLRGRRITVTSAPEPSTILWENFGHGRCEIFFRRSLTFITAASFILLSVGMSIMALYQNQKAESEGGTGECPDGWNSLNDAERLDAVEEDSSILHCYCADKGIASLNPEDDCFQYVQTKLEAFWLAVGTSFIVAFTNAVINYITRRMGAFERHTSMDLQEVAIFQRLVLLKFFNLGLTVLLTNSRKLISLIGISLAYEEDFTPEWYRTLGSSLVLTIVMNAVTPHLYWLGLWARKEWVWKYKRHEAVSQDALNSLVKGARWEISVRYAEITVIFAVCLAYSAGIPILLPIGATSFVLFYWVEKVLFVNFYQTPPQYSERLTIEVVTLMPYILWIHVVVAVYMYGNGSIFPVEISSDQTMEEAMRESREALNFADKLNVKAVRPLLAPLIILTALIAKRWLGRVLKSNMVRFLTALCYKEKLATSELEKMCNTVTVDYSRAVVRGILRGLTSYNILLNPKYKESFGLTERFGYQHKRVGSIFKLLREHPSVLDVRKAMSAEREAKGKASCRGVWSGSGSPSARDASKTAVPRGNTVASVAVAAKGRSALEMTLPSSPRASSPRRQNDAMLHESPEAETRE